MAVETNWVVVTGPPSSGKTTLLECFGADGFITSGDSTRALIARVVEEEGRTAEEFRFAPDFQSRALAAMAESERALDPMDQVVLEYAMPCNIAFHRTERLEVPDELRSAALEFRYRTIIVLDPLDWAADSERVEDQDYQLEVHRHLLAVFLELGYAPYRLPALPIEDRYEAARRCIARDAG